MNNLSIAIVEGNLTSDPELKTISTGKQVCSFSIAMNQNKEVSYIEIQAWDKTAENCSKFLKKGSSVTVMGTIKQQRWMRPDNTHGSKIFIVASNVRFNPSSKKESDNVPTSIESMGEEVPTNPDDIF